MRNLPMPTITHMDLSCHFPFPQRYNTLTAGLNYQHIWCKNREESVRNHIKLNTQQAIHSFNSFINTNIEVAEQTLKQTKPVDMFIYQSYDRIDKNDTDKKISCFMANLKSSKILIYQRGILKTGIIYYADNTTEVFDPLKSIAPTKEITTIKIIDTFYAILKELPIPY